MLVPDILWYEKSILGWFGQPGCTCEKKLGANYEQRLRAGFLCFQGQKKFENIIASALKSCIEKR